MKKRKIGCILTSLAIICEVVMPSVLASGNVFADWRGGSTEDNKYKMYLEVDDQAPVGEIGIKKPDDTVSVEKSITAEHSEIISYDENEGTECIPHGNKVGSGIITCRYLGGSGEELLSVDVLVHVFADPNYHLEEDYGISSNLKVGESFKLLDYVGDYFDNPEEIVAEVWKTEDEESEAVTVTGENVADAVVTAKDVVGLGTIYFHNKYSQQDNDNFAVLDVWTYEEPELSDLTMTAYDDSDEHEIVFEIEDEGNLPPYTLVSSSEDIVKITGDYWNGYTIMAENMGKATITVTYDAYGKPQQSFVVTVKGAEGTHIEPEVKMVNESELDSDEVNILKQAVADGKEVRFYDITMKVLGNDDREVGRISELNEAVWVNIELPNDLNEVTDGYTRKFYILRSHDGEVSKLEVVDNGDGTGKFLNDKFSTFMLYYEDIMKTEEVATEETVVATIAPDTGMVTAAGASASVAAIITAAAVGLLTSITTFAYLMRRRG